MVAVGRPDNKQNCYRTGEEGNLRSYCILEKRLSISMQGNALRKCEEVPVISHRFLPITDKQFSQFSF